MDCIALAPFAHTHVHTLSSPCRVTRDGLHCACEFRAHAPFGFRISSSGPGPACQFLDPRGTPKSKTKPHEKRHLLDATGPGVPRATTLSVGRFGISWPLFAFMASS